MDCDVSQKSPKRSRDPALLSEFTDLMCVMNGNPVAADPDAQSWNSRTGNICRVLSQVATLCLAEPEA